MHMLLFFNIYLSQLRYAVEPETHFLYMCPYMTLKGNDIFRTFPNDIESFMKKGFLFFTISKAFAGNACCLMFQIGEGFMRSMIVY